MPCSFFSSNLIDNETNSDNCLPQMKTTKSSSNAFHARVTITFQPVRCEPDGWHPLWIAKCKTKACNDQSEGKSNSFTEPLSIRRIPHADACSHITRSTRHYHISKEYSLFAFQCQSSTRNSQAVHLSCFCFSSSELSWWQWKVLAAR